MVSIGVCEHPLRSPIGELGPVDHSGSLDVGVADHAVGVEFDRPQERSPFLTLEQAAGVFVYPVGVQ